ncbi:dynein assembly factor 4, axonemal-like [Octopus sinensis]|uniref:Dynein assembly factor 4, axonemal-like n=1 Tax=Octopus sinensis TaxID=2607531 RepID=A0A7E6ELG4_9MOLL|nr:dynein assembly factor 4, axonemal-like [Octopus sinensis]
MVIRVRDVEWGQSESALYLKLELHGSSPSSVDIVCTRRYIKVYNPTNQANYQPYLFECLLYADVEEDESTVVIKEGQIMFNLRKVVPEVWPTFMSEEKTSQIELFKEKENKKVADGLTALKVASPSHPSTTRQNESPKEFPIRDAGKIKMSFTERYFPTPSRESRAEEEEEVSGES